MSYDKLTDQYTTAPARLLEAYKAYIKTPVWNSPQSYNLAKTILEIKDDDFSPAKLTSYRGIADFLSPIHPMTHMNLKYIVDNYISKSKGGDKS